jgi:hypothetical protein
MGGTKFGFSHSLSKPNPYHNDWQYGVRVLGTGSSSPAYRAKAAAKPAMPTKACAATVTMGMEPADEEAEEATEEAAEEADAATDDAALAAEDATLDAEASTDEATLEAEADLDDASLEAEADLDASDLDELALPPALVIGL